MSDKDDIAQDEIECFLDGDHVEEPEIPDCCAENPSRIDALAEIRELVILISIGYIANMILDRIDHGNE